MYLHNFISFFLVSKRFQPGIDVDINRHAALYNNFEIMCLGRLTTAVHETLHQITELKQFK